MIENFDYILKVVVTTVIIPIIIAIYSKLSWAIYSGYKTLLLWMQTYYLRKGITPIDTMVRFCIDIPHRFLRTIIKKEVVYMPKRQPKGLVGVLAVNIQKVNGAIISDDPTELNEIYFADKDGDYDKRNTHLGVDKIKEQCQIICRHYSKIGKEIQNDFQDNPLFYYEELDAENNIVRTPLHKKFLQYYTYESIAYYIQKVNREMYTNNAIHFIGDKLGVRDFKFEQNDNLVLEIYKTDHFTWQVFKEIFKANKPFFQEVMLRVNDANLREKKLLVRCLAFVFSSFGVDIIIESQDCKRKRKLIITARSGGIETSQESSLHVSVNETFSRTDYIDDSKKMYGLYECVQRGIHEEIGISCSDIPTEAIKFHDFAIVTDEGEIGLSCHVNLSEHMPVERILMYPGQDKFLENEELLVLPYFNVLHRDLMKSVDSSKFMHQFYRQTLNDRFNMSWMSFTPLLISRVMIRNIKFTLLWQIIWLIIFWAIVYLFVWKYLPTYHLTVLEQVWALCLNLIALAVINKSLFKRRKYKFIQPVVAQWLGNVRVVQATGNTYGQPVNEGVTLGLSKELISGSVIKLSELELAYPPYCAVRVRKENYSESPISFFQFKKKGANVLSSHLKFFLLNIATGQSETTVCIRFDFATDVFDGLKKIKKISFGWEIEVHVNPDTILPSKHDMYIFKSYLKMTNEHLESLNSNVNIRLPIEFTSHYDLCDLFLYKDNYYWSCIESQIHEKERSCMEFALKDLYSQSPKVNDFYHAVMEAIKLKNEKQGYIVVSLSGKTEWMERILNKFISHRENKRRISELERYMLQLYFIRKGLLVADCEYSNREKFKICRILS